MGWKLAIALQRPGIRDAAVTVGLALLAVGLLAAGIDVDPTPGGWHWRIPLFGG